MEFLFFPGALLCGFLLDLLLGDPESFPHPVRGIGWLIVRLERMMRGARDFDSARTVRRQGTALVVTVVGLTLAASAAVLWVCFLVNIWLAFAVSVLMCWQCISVRCLAREADNVYRALTGEGEPGDETYSEGETGDKACGGNINEARKALSRIVGRDTAALDEEGVTKAALESVAESIADGVIAPLFYLAIGGPCLGLAFKAVNTLDSMVGYKNERYRDFGRAAARLDDFFGYVPARLGAIFMIVACFVLGQDGRGAFRIWRRDGKKHASPNAGQSEAVLAGALGLALAGDASYSGEIVHKPVIGEPGRPAAPGDIKTATRLLFGTSLLFLPLALLISCLIGAGVRSLVMYIN